MSKILYLFLYFLILSVLSQLCVENENNCRKCDIFNRLCSECDLNVFVPNENGGCSGLKKCEVGNNYCDECNEEGNICKKCELDYFPDENGGCSYSNNCEVSNNGECLICKNNYILIGNKNSLKFCKSLFSKDLKNCKSFNNTSGLCESCEENYYLNEGDKRCSDVENCYKSNYNNCIKCISGFYLDKKDNKCKKQESNFLNCLQTIDGLTCDKCDDDYFFDEENKCVPTKFCLRSSKFECEECISGYYLAEDKSCCMEKNCNSTYKDTGACNWCSNNFYLNSENKCIPYSENENELKFCKIFNDKCIKCENNYTFGEDNKCVKTKNCAESENGICSLCSKGYYLGSDKKCTNKEHCIYSNDNYLCIECEDNYYWDNTFSVCKEIGDNKIYIGCKVSWTGYKCGSCKKGYYFNNTDLLCYDNNVKNKYFKCSRVYAGICNECEDGYFYEYGTHKCNLIEFCLYSDHENICTECMPNYCLDSKIRTCINNKEINNKNINYFRCRKTNEEGKCEICEENMILKEGLCYNEKDCIEKNGDICIKCGNSNNNSCLNNIFGCVDTKVENCLKCDNLFDLNTCTQCLEGFELNENGKCINSS